MKGIIAIQNTIEDHKNIYVYQHNLSLSYITLQTLIWLGIIHIFCEQVFMIILREILLWVNISERTDWILDQSQNPNTNDFIL